MEDPERMFGDYLSRNVRAIRERRGLSQEELAHQMAERGLGWHQATVYKVESGQRRVRLAEAVVLSEELDVPLDALVQAPKDIDAVERMNQLRADITQLEGRLVEEVDNFTNLRKELGEVVAERQDLAFAPPGLSRMWTDARETLLVAGDSLVAAVERFDRLSLVLKDETPPLPGIAPDEDSDVEH